MADRESFFKALDEFVNKPRDQSVLDKVKRFAAKAQEKGLISGPPVFREQEEIDVSPVLAFFAPVGYRKLFEQEIEFLLDEGHSYDSIMSMPIPRRKSLIRRKTTPVKNRDRRLDEIPELPPKMQEQLRAAQSMVNGNSGTGE